MKFWQKLVRKVQDYASYEEKPWLIRWGKAIIQKLYLAYLKVFRFGVMTYRICDQRDIFSLAQALSYTTVLSLIPLFMIFFFVLGRIMQDEQALQQVLGYISSYLLPDFVSSLTVMLESLSSQATKLGLIAFPSMVVVGVFLFMKVDYSINRLWLSIGRRGLFSNLSVFVYSAIVGPILIVLVLSLPTYIQIIANYTNFGLGVGGTRIVNFVVDIVPWLTSFLLFVAIYRFIPLEKVVWRSAVYGAFWTSLLMQLINWGIGTYIANIAKFDVIYSSLAFLPIVMLWLYTVWLLILFGSVLVYVHQTTTNSNFHWTGIRKAQDSTFNTALQIVLYLTEVFKRRLSHPNFFDLSQIFSVDKDKLNDILRPLLKKSILSYSLSPTNKRYDTLQLACDPSRIKVEELLNLFAINTLNIRMEKNLQDFILQTNVHPIFHRKDLNLSELYDLYQQNLSLPFSERLSILEPARKEDFESALSIRNLKIYTTIGAYKWEQTLLQEILVDLKVFTNLSDKNDQLDQVIDYAKLEERLKVFFEDKRFRLLETVADQLLEQIKAFIGQRFAVWIRVSKPRIQGSAEMVSVERIFSSP